MASIYRKDFWCKSDVIEYGANINHSDDYSLISTYNLVPDSYYIIVGRLIPDNNADLIVEGFVNSDSKKKLIIVGDVPYKDSYAEKIKSIVDDRLQFVGYVKDRILLDQLVKHSYGYFHGHEFGGTNPTLLEALSNNAKILALDTVFTREVLKDGEYGLFFEKNKASVTNLVHSIEEIPDLLNKFINKGVKRIEERYNWKRIIDLYSDVFNQSIK
jgi:glycosyltransferase involved in cell wall biosynthesis